jgi:hypothetical protein
MGWSTSVLTLLVSDICQPLVGLLKVTSPFIALPLLLVTLQRTVKPQDLFKLSSLCHISIKVESCKSQNTLTQCYNCQKLGHVWANCKQPLFPPLLVVWGRPHAQRLPGEGERISTPACCNCQLAEGETAHPANYRRCRHAQEEMRKKPQGTPKRTTGRVFS